MKEPVDLKKEDGTALIMLNRPEAYNAFNLDMVGLLAEILTELALDRQVRGVVISGEGRAFCAGGDLRWINGAQESYGRAFHQLAARYHQAILEIRRMPKPVVAAINGLAAGGGFSMALACDFRIMEASAVLRQAYTSNGLSIDGGGTYTLPRLIGMARALEIAAFDEPIGAEKAISWGIVTEVVSDGEGVDRALEMVRRIAKGSLTSFGASKRLLSDSFSTPFEVQLENERTLLSWVADQPDGREGVGAFLEKRNPRFW
ncbi:MAG: enoyl-CoA hydratase/isomerase family protein [Deltaproteobacteria bacterium]|nr:enoyl-CoA hydratase/isomerase family protein [Deltaproteobacteria bacterium]MBW2112080.1 enoyl-CoA hydratase/isomerase family protein [Deltaproteobacteria bacterium]MBW2352723.1 enoyl-CoA hydratase/isomerase family protein [Deltaproteobacteria bacterium]HDZ91258.1 enoyl-CoA hydratase/isomerase family protein [Deltaproteobacteria bacterium]